MTTVHDAAYVAALERKLIEAERAIYGFRAIWNNYNSMHMEPTVSKEVPGVSRIEECTE